MKYGKIIKIEEIYNDKMEGYKITTTKEEINIGISNHQSCCESYGSCAGFQNDSGGYIITEDELNNFKMAEIKDVLVVDQLLDVFDGDTWKDEDLYASFVNIETDKGTLQFVVYNSHNGYYGHDIRIWIDSFDYYELLEKGSI